MQIPTCTNTRIRSTQDAHKIFLAVQNGVLPLITRRLDADERLALRSGCVYAWEERPTHAEITGLGIERFTEGRRWSPSRVRDEFLFYYEKYSPPPESSQGGPASKDKQPPPDWDPLVKQTYSVYVETDKGRRKLHLTAYFTQTTVDNLDTIDELPGVGDLYVPDNMFESTRVSKSNRKDEPRGRNSDVFKPTASSSVTRTYAPFPAAYPTPQPLPQDPRHTPHPPPAPYEPHRPQNAQYAPAPAFYPPGQMPQYSYPPPPPAGSHFSLPPIRSVHDAGYERGQRLPSPPPRGPATPYLADAPPVLRPNGGEPLYPHLPTLQNGGPSDLRYERPPSAHWEDIHMQHRRRSVDHDPPYPYASSSHYQERDYHHRRPMSLDRESGPSYSRGSAPPTNGYEHSPYARHASPEYMPTRVRNPSYAPTSRDAEYQQPPPISPPSRYTPASRPAVRHEASAVSWSRMAPPPHQSPPTPPPAEHMHHDRPEPAHPQSQSRPPLSRGDTSVPPPPPWYSPAPSHTPELPERQSAMFPAHTESSSSYRLRPSYPPATADQPPSPPSPLERVDTNGRYNAGPSADRRSATPPSPYSPRHSPGAYRQPPRPAISSVRGTSDDDVDSHASGDSARSVGPSRRSDILAPLHMLQRIHPYRRDPLDDKTLRRLKPA